MDSRPEMPLLCWGVSPGERNFRAKVDIYATQDSPYFVAFCHPFWSQIGQIITTLSAVLDGQPSLLIDSGTNPKSLFEAIGMVFRDCMLSDRVAVKNSGYRGKEIPNILREFHFMSWNYLSKFLRDLKIPQ
jgi:hypothetical protein